jgi:hypothetical protein
MRTRTKMMMDCIDSISYSSSSSYSSSIIVFQNTDHVYVWNDNQVRREQC